MFKHGYTFFTPTHPQKKNKTIKVLWVKNVAAMKEMINEELLCIEHHTKCGILCECVKAKPELNEQMINKTRQDKFYVVAQ